MDDPADDAYALLVAWVGDDMELATAILADAQKRHPGLLARHLALVASRVMADIAERSGRDPHAVMPELWRRFTDDDDPAAAAARALITAFVDGAEDALSVAGEQVREVEFAPLVAHLVGLATAATRAHLAAVGERYPEDAPAAWRRFLAP